MIRMLSKEEETWSSRQAMKGLYGLGLTDKHGSSTHRQARQGLSVKMADRIAP